MAKKLISWVCVTNQEDVIIRVERPCGIFPVFGEAAFDHAADFIVDFTHLRTYYHWGRVNQILRDEAQTKFNADFGIYFCS